MGEINNKKLDTSKDLDFVKLMYTLIVYSDTYEKILRSFCQDHKGYNKTVYE